MSHRGGASAPQPERDRSLASPSPARDALQGNLDTGRTVTTKKSWFGSARNMISRHVPLWKIEEPRPEARDENVDEASNESEDGTSLKQAPSSSNDSTTPLRPRPQRSRTFTPKTAVSSLRQHIQSSRGGRKRGALCDITGNEARIPVDPGSLAALEAGTSEETFKTHARKNSLGRSLVGSIRNLGSQSLPSRRMSPTKRRSQDGEALLSPTRGATEVPLPSSPIPIPRPPTLQLDLGPAALVTPSFGRSPVMSQHEELMGLTNPSAMSTNYPVPTYYTRLPGEGPIDHVAAALATKDSLQPSDLLHLPGDDFCFSLPSGQTTPMPGAGTELELDGAGDPSEIFERSLEYKDKAKKKEDRKLKKMVSLDAMAEECTANSPVRASPASRSSHLDAPVPGDTSLRQISGSSISVVPEDMPPLTRQVANLQAPEAGHRDPKTGEWQSEDPFAPGNAVGDLAGPPSPTRSVKLPFRPKITLQSVDSPEPRTLRLSHDVPTPTAEGINFSAFPKAPADMCFVDRAAESKIRPSPGRSDSVVSNVDSFSPTEAERLGRIVSANGSQIHGNHTDDPASSSGPGDPVDYGEFKTQHIFGDLQKVEEPEYDAVERAESMSLIQSLRHSPSVKQIYERISKSHTPSPRSVRAGTTHKVDVADIFWKFQGLAKGSDESSPAGLDGTPPSYRNTADLSIDLLSVAGDRSTPAPSPTTTTPDRTPMGSRIDFDLKRSARNMRYNALSEMSDTPDHQSTAKDSEGIPAAWRRKMRIVTGSFKTKELEGFSSDDAFFADDEIPSSNKRTARYSAVNLSSDSIAAELKDAIAEHHVYQNAMGYTEPDDLPTPTVSSSQALLDGGHEADGSGELSPSTSAHLWEDMEHCVFDTPLGGSTTVSPNSKHHRESQEYTSNEESDNEGFRFKPTKPAEDTLDECLEMFQHYNKFQVLSSDPPMPSDQTENPFRSPVSENSQSPRSNASSPGKKPSPARYRSIKSRRGN